MPRLSRPLIAAVAGLFASAFVSLAVPPDEKSNGKADGKKRDADAALAQVQAPKGLKVEVWASEPLLANPVAFAFDEQGKCYVAETTRFAHGVPDTRSYMYWLDDDLACRTVADRLAMYKRSYPGKKPYTGYESYSDQLRVVWDSTGAGLADKSAVFSGGYNRPEDGLAAGVLARKGNVYFTNVPDLYLLKDTKGSGTADVKKSLSTGYGVRAQFLGHDLHGLRMGPDGRLYFSIGDRGLNVTRADGQAVVNTESGAVLRCDLDGGNLELVHTGLRNPQELAFDDAGNLFTFDNNCDSGDQARWVYVVEGGDSGWRCGFQYDTDYSPPGAPRQNRGPWNVEHIWHGPARAEKPPAYVVPALHNFGSGPAGLTHYPGVGLNDRYKDHFFACDFTSSANNSKIWSLAAKPKGAAFEVTDLEQFVKGMVPTDCEFGPDGAFYWSDWVGGWNPPNKGRIFRVSDPDAMKNPAVGEARTLLAEGFEKRAADELLKLLDHPHQQVRLEAQYELAGRGAEVVKRLQAVVGESKSKTARVHAIWALGMIARNGNPSRVGLLPFTLDPDPEIRGQVARVLGWRRGKGDEGKILVREALAKLLHDDNPRVRFLAAQSYGHTLHAQPVPDLTRPVLVDNPDRGRDLYRPLFALLKSNNNQDAYIRHGAVEALANLRATPDQPFTVWKELGPEFDTPAVRLGVVLALRRLHGGKADQFLSDPDPAVAAEAARAIHDERIGSALPALARMTTSSGLPDAVMYRALSACAKLGSRDAAGSVAGFAARAGEPDHLRVFALKLLATWDTPPRRDPITGQAQSLPARSAPTAGPAMRPVVAGIFRGSDAVRAQATKTAAAVGLKEVGPLLAGMVKDSAAPVASRVDALQALLALNDPAVKELAAVALATADPKLRAAGRAAKSALDPKSALQEIPALLDDEAVSLAEKQGAFAVLGKAGDSADVDSLLSAWLGRLGEGKVPAELQLDLLDAAEARASRRRLKLHAPLGDMAKKYRASAETSADKLAHWSETLAGGDADRGRQVVLANAAVYCVRCHKLDGQGGDVGPVLNGIAGQPGKDRRYLLEAVVQPSAQIAKGYETVVLTLADGRVVSGILRGDDKKTLKLMNAEGKEVTVPVEDVEARRTGPSAMPDDLHKKLTRHELRDIVEFLASLKEPAPSGVK